MKNIAEVHFWLESGCSQDDGEVSMMWQPLNFMIYSPLFQDMIEEFSEEWLGDNRLEVETEYRVLVEHVVEYDGAGALMAEYFQQMANT